jgi:hypothetical protein
MSYDGNQWDNPRSTPTGQPPTGDTLYLSDILLLCVTCHQPIKAVITTEQWVKVEWISPDGECRECVRKAKEERHGQG